MIFDTTSPWGTWKPKTIAALLICFIDKLPVCGVFRRLAFFLRKPIKSGTQGYYDREIWGFKLRLTARGNLTEQRWLTMANFHDNQERSEIAAVVGPGSVFLDIGANAGFYTFWALSLRHEGLRVMAVEPTPVMLERLKFNLAQNGLTESVTIIPCAVTAEPCEVFIEQHSENIGQSGIQSNGSGLKVIGLPLLNILLEQKFSRVDAMKIDIEGMEVAVLKPFFLKAPKALWPKMIIGEIVGNQGEALLQLLHENGYHLKKSTKMNGIFLYKGE